MTDQTLPAWVETLPKHWGERFPNGEWVRWADLVAACPPEANLQSELLDLITLMPDSQVDEILAFVATLRDARRRAALPPAVPAPQVEVQENRDVQSRRKPPEQP